MIDTKVIEYIKSEIAKGVTRDEITKNLLNGGGWTPTEIQSFFSVIDGKPIPENNGRKANYSIKSGAILGWNLFILFIYELSSYIMITVGENGVHRTLSGYSNLPDSLMPVYEHYDYLRKFGLEKLVWLFILHAFILFIISAIKKDSQKPAAPWVGAGMLVFIIGIIVWFGFQLMCYDRC